MAPPKSLHNRHIRPIRKQPNPHTNPNANPNPYAHGVTNANAFTNPNPNTFAITLTGDGAPWATPSHTSVTLQEGGTAEVTVQVSVPESYTSALSSWSSRLGLKPPTTSTWPLGSSVAV